MIQATSNVAGTSFTVALPLAICLSVATTSQAQRAAKLPGHAVSVDALLIAPNEADKVRIFMALRHQLTAADVLRIIQNERTDSIAALAVGTGLERLDLAPREGAHLLFTFAQRPGLSGLAATLGAISGQAGPIAGELAAVETRGKGLSPRLLAAEILATYAWIEAHPASVAASSSSGSAERPDKAGRVKKKRTRGKAAASTHSGDWAAPLDKLLTAKEAEVLEAAVLAAAWLQYEQARPAVAALDSSRLPAIQASRLLYLARLGDDPPAELIEKVFAHSPPVLPRYAELSPALATYEIRTSPWVYASEALGQWGDPQHLPRLQEALQHRDLRVQVEAARAMEQLGTVEAVPALLAKIASSRTPWPVLVAALSAVGALPAREAIPPLIDRLRRESGRFRLDVNYALASIAGGKQGTSADEWSDWWKANSATFAVAAERTARFRAQNRVQDMKDWPVGRFYNLDLFSERLVFVLDTSNSMHGKRIESLKTNLTNTLQGLKLGVRFNVVDFGGHLAVMKPGGLIAEAEVPAAVQRVEHMTLSLGTRTYDALELATRMPDVDTLVLMSDGAPVCGKFEAWKRIIAAVSVLNRYRPLAIWGLEFTAKERNLGGMSELTECNSGHTRSSEP